MARKPDSQRPPPIPPALAPRRSSAAKAWLLAILAFAGCCALGYYYWELREAFLEQKGAAGKLEAAARKAEKSEQAAVTDAEACATTLSTAEAKALTCATERENDAQHTQELSSAQQKMEADLKATATELASLRELKVQAEKHAAAFAELEKQLKEMIAGKQLALARRDGRVIVQLPAEILFESGRAQLSEPGKIALIKLSAVLERLTDRQLMVAGHTDAEPPIAGSQYPNNWALSTARAVTVTELLITANIDPESLVVAGYGEFAPIGDNKTKEGRKLNRRIEIILLPNVAELAAFDKGAALDPGGGT